jgi:hypothetical protein
MGTFVPRSYNERVKDRKTSQSPLQPPQFTTPVLLLTTGGLAVLLAILRLCPPYIAFAIFLLAGSILVHVLGNYLGTRLRDGVQGDGQLPMEDADDIPSQGEARFAPRPGLSQFIRLGRGMVICISVGGTIAAVVGTWLLVQLQPGVVHWHHLLLAVVSCGVLGGLLTFWIVSFLWVFIQAIAEGHRHK